MIFPATSLVIATPVIALKSDIKLAVDSGEWGCLRPLGMGDCGAPLVLGSLLEERVGRDLVLCQ